MGALSFPTLGKAGYNQLMVRQLEAVYEHGMLRPLQPLSLEDRQHVLVTITDLTLA